MSHDLEDLLEIIKMLEERIIALENCQWLAKPAPAADAYYWEHG